jgi:hypothetical protein
MESTTNHKTVILSSCTPVKYNNKSNHNHNDRTSQPQQNNLKHSITYSSSGTKSSSRKAKRRCYFCLSTNRNSYTGARVKNFSNSNSEDDDDDDDGNDYDYDDDFDYDDGDFDDDYDDADTDDDPANTTSITTGTTNTKSSMTATTATTTTSTPTTIDYYSRYTTARLRASTPNQRSPLYARKIQF